MSTISKATTSACLAVLFFAFGCEALHAQVVEYAQRSIDPEESSAVEVPDVVPGGGFAELPADDLAATPPPPPPSKPNFDAGYDNGIFLKLQKATIPSSSKPTFEVSFGSFRSVETTPLGRTNRGTVRPVENRHTFDIERVRLILSGHAFTPKLKYFVQMDGDTDSQHVISILDGWFAWHFSDLLEVQFGKRKVPGTRNWMLGAFDTRLADRAFANEFFRPSRTTGIWFVGDPTNATHYELMVGQGYNTEGLTPSETGDDFAVAGTSWWDVVGSYGPGATVRLRNPRQTCGSHRIVWVNSK